MPHCTRPERRPRGAWSRLLPPDGLCASISMPWGGGWALKRRGTKFSSKHGCSQPQRGSPPLPAALIDLPGLPACRSSGRHAPRGPRSAAHLAPHHHDAAQLVDQNAVPRRVAQLRAYLLQLVDQPHHRAKGRGLLRRHRCASCATRSRSAPKEAFGAGESKRSGAERTIEQLGRAREVSMPPAGARPFDCHGQRGGVGRCGAGALPAVLVCRCVGGRWRW